jgi:hypothetical protein
MLRSVLVAAVVLLALTPSAAAAAPPNDNRAAAEVLPSFPAQIHGTFAEATVERLDPQVSPCGTIASTLWYRIDVAPDGMVAVSLRAAAGVAPVVRIYRQRPSAIAEEDCGAAAVGGTATASVETTRGANYLIMVGRRTTSPDGEFDLRVELTLPPDPPGNDRSGAARRIVRIPSTVSGTTVGARSEESDPTACGLETGSVWYRLAPPRSGLVILQLRMARTMDGVAVVLRRAGSRLRVVTCGETARGRATVPFAAVRDTTYIVAVGQPEDSDAGAFTLGVVSAQPAETTAPRTLPRGGARAAVNGLTDVNDLWAVRLAQGTSYRISFASPGCAVLHLRRQGRSAPLVRLRCNGYRVFTPGPDGGGRYVLEVRAAPSQRGQPYRLQLQPVGADDVGVGIPLRNHAVRRGTLAPQGVDVLDVYHFDVQERSDVRLTLTQPGGRSLALVLATEEGARIGRGTTIRRALSPGRYVAAVSAPAGSPGGAYGLALLVRTITATTLAIEPQVAPFGSSFVLRPLVTPSAGGTVAVQIDRFDPFGGWQFNRTVRLPVSGSLTWRPPTRGTWRARAAFLGTSTHSPSRSAYARVSVR